MPLTHKYCSKVFHVMSYDFDLSLDEYLITSSTRHYELPCELLTQSNGPYFLTECTFMLILTCFIVPITVLLPSFKGYTRKFDLRSTVKLLKPMSIFCLLFHDKFQNLVYSNPHACALSFHLSEYKKSSQWTDTYQYPLMATFNIH